MKKISLISFPVIILINAISVISVGTMIIGFKGLLGKEGLVDN
jgi:hypothetical protein